MSKFRNRFILVAVAAIIGLLLAQRIDDSREQKAALGQSAQRAEPRETVEKPAIGYAAPAFKLTGLDGKTHELKKMRGKPVVLNFWASWCGPCRDEAPAFDKLNRLYGDRVQIVAVNLTATDSAQAAKTFARDYGFTFPVVLDTDGKVAAAYAIRPIPTTVFVDSRGMIANGALGALDWHRLERLTRDLLEPGEPREPHSSRDGGHVPMAG
ncbi:TlpA family protein disulfide reductase [Paenibacillaceae bacterium WGS1546]|uniref:TlpA family protein disulfide reductase n=1 Tax=Cohnella sp. WGS1546 TaxID=3366810 RepID=UPI00372CF725